MTIIWIALFALFAAQAAPISGSAVIEGIVVKAGTDEPLPGVDVELALVVPATITDPAPQPGPPPTVFSITTSDDGRFAFRALQEGTYRLLAIRRGGAYVPVEYGQRSPKGRGTTIAIRSGQRIQNLWLPLALTGSISGRVFDNDDEPVANARVMAFEPNYRNGRRVLNTVQSVRTNDMGEYRLFWLRPGRYYVGVIREELRMFSFSVHVTPPEHFGSREDGSGPRISERKLDDGSVIEETDLLVYYGGGIDPNRAQAVELPAGSSVSAIDIPMGNARVRSHHVKGIVVDGSGKPVGGALVRLVPIQPAPHTVIPNAEADRAGVFNIPGVIPGSYYIVAAVGASRGFSFNESIFDISAGTSAILPIDVPAQDVENLTVILKSPYSLAGRIAVEGTDPANTPWDMQRSRVFFVRDPDLLGLPAGRFGGPRPVAPQPGVPSLDGNFVLNGFGDGSYRVRVGGLPLTAYVKAIRFGARDVLNEGIVFDNPPQGELEIVIGRDGGTLQGMTLNGRSEPVMNAIVALVPDTPSRASAHLYKTAASDSSGGFTMKGIAPGNYKVFAWEDVIAGAWQDPEFIGIYEGKGKPVTFSDSAMQQIQISVIPN
jgi:hypothetical protein